MKTLVVSRGLKILTGKLCIFIAKMTGGQNPSLVPSPDLNILLFYDDGACLFPGVLRRQRGQAGRGWAKGCSGHSQGALRLNQQHTSASPLGSW